MERAIDLENNRILEGNKGSPTSTFLSVARSVVVNLDKTFMAIDRYINAIEDLEEARFNLFWHLRIKLKI
jgi:hypothetical protein